jgi:endonuclease/exonuclease/phosphatase family metal-dependent hydrolase
MKISDWNDRRVHIPLKVGTFNVRWDYPGDGEQRWKYRQEHFSQLLREWSPDLLGLQEPLREQLDDIRGLLPDHEEFGVGREDGLLEGEFCPILFRKDRLQILTSGTFWLSDTPDVPGSRHWGNRIPRICTWARLQDLCTGQSFYLYNTHLDHESQAARERGVALVMDMIKQRPSHDPAILTGDFNALPDNPAIISLKMSVSPVPVDAVFAASPASAEQGTFHGFTGRAKGERIDYIFVSPEWRIKDARVLSAGMEPPYPSDHFPVGITLDSPVLSDEKNNT